MLQEARHEAFYISGFCVFWIGVQDLGNLGFMALGQGFSVFRFRV